MTIVIMFIQLLTEEAKRKVTDDTKQEEEEKDEVSGVSTRLEVELNRQRELYEDLMRKTHQLHQLQQVNIILYLINC